MQYELHTTYMLSSAFYPPSAFSDPRFILHPHFLIRVLSSIRIFSSAFYPPSAFSHPYFLIRHPYPPSVSASISVSAFYPYPKFKLYFRRLNFFLWSIVIVLLLQEVHCQRPPVYTAESCSNESVFWFFSEQTAIQQSHIINPLLTSFARSVRESIAFGFYRTDLAPSSLGLHENLRQYFPVQTSHSVNKSLVLVSFVCKSLFPL